MIFMHDYVSTACLHELHEKCRQICKYCSDPCGCPCHAEEVSSEDG